MIDFPAPSATTMMLNFDPASSRDPYFSRLLTLHGKRNLRDQDHIGASGDSGMQRNPARRGGPSPRESSPGRVIQPLYASRSSASVAISSAVAKPNVNSVQARSLSIVLGTPRTGTPSRLEFGSNGQGSFATDYNQALDSEALEISEGLSVNSNAGLTATPSELRSENLPLLRVPRIVPPRGKQAANIGRR